MKDRVEVYKGRRLRRGARLILKYGLHFKEDKGLIYHRIRDILTDDRGNVKKSISLFWHNDVAVACAFLQGKRLMAFCNARQRGKGYSTDCIKALTSPDVVYYAQDAEPFWKKQHCKVRMNYIWA